jgi:transposase
MKGLVGRWWLKYSPEFKTQAVKRMKAGEKITALSRELGVSRKFLYQWRNQGWGEITTKADGKVLEPEEVDPLNRENESLKKKVGELERLLGQKTGELDFFAAALRNVEELRPKRSSSSGGKSTRRLSPLHKAEQA